MKTIQTAGQEILNGNPEQFYIFTGPEYGVKQKYLQHLKDRYPSYKESDSVTDLVNFFKSKHIIPIEPALHIVRYDQQFISGLGSKTEEEINRTNIIGTVVCLYDSDKDHTKCDKYMSNHTVRFDPVAAVFVKKYLQSDFPDLPERFIDFALQCRQDYISAQSICRCISELSEQSRNQLRGPELLQLFAISYSSDEKELQQYIAYKDFARFVESIESFSGDLSNIFYLFLNTMIELEKIKLNSYAQSDIRGSENSWGIEDVVNMFNHSYDQLKKSRQYSTYDVTNGLIYLASLMCYNPIPRLEDLSWT